MQKIRALFILRYDFEKEIVLVRKKGIEVQQKFSLFILILFSQRILQKKEISKEITFHSYHFLLRKYMKAISFVTSVIGFHIMQQMCFSI